MKRHGKTSHLFAAMLIEYLISEGGSSSLPSTDIARRLGITENQFHGARVHTLECSSLGGYTVAYRDKNKEIVLMDPADHGRVVSALVGDRTDPMFMGARRLRDNWLIAQARIVAIIEAAAREALARGDKATADALGYAATDYATYGEVQPATAALLRSLGVKAA